MPESTEKVQYLEQSQSAIIVPENWTKIRKRVDQIQDAEFLDKFTSWEYSAEDLFANAAEYLVSGCVEVWLIFPESNRLLIITQTQTLAFHSSDKVSTQKVLLGFCVLLSEIFN